MSGYAERGKIAARGKDGSLPAIGRMGEGKNTPSTCGNDSSYGEMLFFILLVE
jgi:hypothetical protein